MEDSKLGRHWGLVIVGIALIVVAIVLLFIPAETLLAVVIVSGIVLVVSGIAIIITYIVLHKKRDISGWSVAYAVIDILIGLMLLIHPIAFASIIPELVGVFTIVFGVFEIVAALVSRGQDKSAWVWTLISGIVCAVCGVMFFVVPGAAIFLLALFIFLRGVSLIMYGFMPGISIMY